jgi:hypothetical protein
MVCVDSVIEWLAEFAKQVSSQGLSDCLVSEQTGKLLSSTTISVLSSVPDDCSTKGSDWNEPECTFIVNTDTPAEKGFGKPVTGSAEWKVPTIVYIENTEEQVSGYDWVPPVIVGNSNAVIAAAWAPPAC